MMAKKTGLGKGISALFDTEFHPLEEEINEVKNQAGKKEANEASQKSNEKVYELKLIEIEPNKEQARKHFDEKKIEELSESIKQFGVIQPIVVAKKEGYYEIIAGERRWRASKLAGIKTIPAIVLEDNQKKNTHISIIENVQRENLNPIEKARGYKQVMEDYDLTVAELASKIGKSTTQINESVNILNLDSRVIKEAEKGKLSEAQCKTLLEIVDGDIQYEVALYMVEDGLSAEEAKRRLNVKTTKTKKIVTYDPIFKEIEEKFSRCFGTKTKLKASPKNPNKGQIVIKYTSTDDLERLLDLLGEIED